MPLIHGDNIRQSYNLAVTRDMRPSDLAICWLQREGVFSLYDKTEMTSQMKLWRKLAKEGKVKMGHYNNKDKKEGGRDWAILVVQPYDPITNKMKECDFDPMGLFIMGEMVSGFIYAFRSKENRDKVFEYVMKDIVPPNPDADSEEEEEEEEEECYYCREIRENPNGNYDPPAVNGKCFYCADEDA